MVYKSICDESAMMAAEAQANRGAANRLLCKWEAAETPNVAANAIVGFGAPLTVTLATGDGTALEAGLVDLEMANLWERLYIVLPPESRSRMK